MTPRNDLWPEEQMNRLRELNKTSMSGTEIMRAMNQEFGTCYTRNAIIGKRTRMGLKGPNPRVEKIKKPAKVGNFNFTKQRYNNKVRKLPTPQKPAMELNVQYACDIFGLNNKTCRFPIGDPRDKDFHYCGMPDADVAAGRSYCGIHSKIVWQQRYSS